MKKLNFISGFKGTLCILVLLHHFSLLFYPDFVNGVNENTNIIIKSIVNSPFNILGYGGQLAVSFFFIISAFLITYIHYSSKSNPNYSRKIISRFLNLTFIIIVSVIFSFSLAKTFKILGLLDKSYLVHNSYYKNLDFDYLVMIKDAIYNTIRSNSSTFNPPLWTMKTELFGSYLVYCFLNFFSNNEKRKYLYIMMILLFINSLYIYFVIGIILGDLFVNKKEIYNISLIKKICMLILSIYFCGHTYLNSGTTVYKYLNTILSSIGDSVHISSIIGSTLFFILLLSSKKIKYVFSIKPILKISNHSTSVYIFHWVLLYTITLFSVSKIFTIINNYKVSVLIGLGILLLMLSICCSIYKKYFTKLSKKFENYLCSLIIKNN